MSVVSLVSAKNGLSVNHEQSAQSEWIDICGLDDLVAYSGVSALVGETQIAIFYIPGAEPALYALDNWCPAAKANVLSRGIVGDVNGEFVVASPLYKEHFSLITGHCVEKPLQVSVWGIRLMGNRVQVSSGAK